MMMMVMVTTDGNGRGGVTQKHKRSMEPFNTWIKKSKNRKKTVFDFIVRWNATRITYFGVVNVVSCRPVLYTRFLKMFRCFLKVD
jgi:hypothetical protein